MNEALAPSVIHSDPKGREFMSIVEDAYNTANLSQEDAQRVNETPGLGKLIARFLYEKRSPNKFQSEERLSTRSYLFKPIPIREQVNRLRIFFPKLTLLDTVTPCCDLPEYADDWFAVPPWYCINSCYSEAVFEVFDLLRSTLSGKFETRVSQKEFSLRVRNTKKNRALFSALGGKQEKNDIFVFPAQLGLQHRGKSIRRVREVLLANECGLDTFTVGVMLLTHPERFTEEKDLGIHCTGDEFNEPKDSDPYSRTPAFCLYDQNKLCFEMRLNDRPDDFFGSATAFLS